MPLLAVALLGPAPTCGEATTDDRVAFACASAAWQTQTWDAALNWLKRAERLRPRARYVYNRALVLEKLGRYADARTQLARVGAMPDATDDDRRLADTRATQLAPRLDAAELVVPDGHRVQVAKAVLGPGTHRLDGAAALVCAPTTELRCRHLALELGRRHDWPVADRAVTGIVDVTAWMPAEVTVDGTIVLFKGGRLRLDAGTHEIGVDDGRQTVTLTPDSVHVVERPPPPPVPSSWPWVVGGTGLATTAAGGVLLALGVADHDAAKNETERKAEARWMQGNDELMAGWTLTSVGVVAVGTAVAWWLLER